MNDKKIELISAKGAMGAWLSTWGNLRKNKQPKEPHEAFLREL